MLTATQIYLIVLKVGGLITAYWAKIICRQIRIPSGVSRKDLFLCLFQLLEVAFILGCGTLFPSSKKPATLHLCPFLCSHIGLW